VKRARNKPWRGKAICWVEYGAAYCAVRIAQLMPLRLGHFVSRVAGYFIYYLVPRRRRIALENLRRVFAEEKTEPAIRKLARESCYSFVASLFEAAKFVALLRDQRGAEKIKATRAGWEHLFEKAKTIHNASGGCVFVTPHIGNWEFLPYVSCGAGIPLVIVVRPLDNPYMERFLALYRGGSGQMIVPKKNSLYFLQTALRQGKSVGLLPDQSTMKAITVDYMGRKATTTPIPALLAVLYHRPIVVVACCRASTKFRYQGYVSDPIWPAVGASEKTEIFRLTQAMNQEMEKIVYQYPEQYFWMHDRWKQYRTRGELFHS
jgi:KDO2-lipid IV(A) lauroyltransferase